MWRGKGYFLHGANLPWINFGNDFGGGSSTGMSNATNQTTANTNLANMKNAGMTVVRWWVFATNKSSGSTEADSTHLLHTTGRGTGTTVGTVTGATYSSGTITYTLSSVTGTITPGQTYITVSGITPSGYNQTVPILVYAYNAGAKQITVGNQFTNPGAYTSGGTVSTGTDAWASNYFILDSAGYPIGLQPNVIADFDAAITVLKNNNMRAIFTLFNGPDSLPQTTGWNDDRGQRALIDTLTVLFNRYRRSPAVLGWELGNEWDTYVNNFYPIVNQQSGNKLISMFANAVHSSSPIQTASVSCGNASLINQFTGLGLDFYGASWYNASNGSFGADYNMGSQTASHYITNYSLDAPVLVEEAMVGVDNSSVNVGSGLANSAQVQARYQYFYDNGFLGCLGWSAAGAGDNMNIDYTGATNFASGKTDLGPGPSV